MKGILLCSVVPFLMLLTIEPYEMEQASIVGMIVLWLMIVINYAYIQSSWRNKPVLKISTNWKIDPYLDDGEKFSIIKEKLRKKYFWYVVMLSVTILSISITLVSQWWFSSTILAGIILTEYYGLKQIDRLNKEIKEYRQDTGENTNSLSPYEKELSEPLQEIRNEEFIEVQNYYDLKLDLKKRIRNCLAIIAFSSAFLILMILVVQPGGTALYTISIVFLIVGIYSLKKLIKAKKELNKLKEEEFMWFDDKEKLT